MSDGGQQPADTRVPRRLDRKDVLAGAIFAAVVMLSGLFEAESSPIRWLYLGLAAALGFVAQLTPVVELLSAAIYRLLRAIGPKLARRMVVWFLVWTLLIGVAVVLGSFLVPLASRATQWVAVRLNGCPAATHLQVLSTPEDLATANQVTDAYVLSTARTHQGCPTVRFYNYALPAEEGQDQLRTGWLADQLQERGPRPDIQWPGTTRYAMTDADRAAINSLLLVDRQVVARTPVVLAAPPGTSDDVKDLLAESWSGALTQAEGRDWEVIRPESEHSAPAEIATYAIYTSGPEVVVDVIDEQRAQEIERRFALSAAAGGYVAGDSADLLCQQRKQVREDSAFVITEHQMVRYNAGLALNERDCALDVKDLASYQTLKGVYPDDTLMVDYPVVGLTWRNASDQQRDQIDAFLDWLRADEGKSALNAAGLRPMDGPFGTPINDRYGAQTTGAYPSELSDDLLAKVNGRQKLVVAPTRVLFTLDASGSMAGLIGNGPQTRFGVAVDGVKKSMVLTGPKDQIGLSIFQGNARAPDQLRDFGRHSAADLAAALDQVKIGGNTPLYLAIQDGVAKLSADKGDGRKALVVLTDGHDLGSGISPEEMLSAVKDKNVNVFIIAIGEANCAAKALREVTTQTRGGCFDVPFSNIDVALEDLFQVL